ncbi:MAG: response regulator [Elusimicrobia bacterium]|nr:response regulator [Elusimicrobiota bacterium]
MPSGARVLIVDDELCVRDILRRQLESRGYSTAAAGSAEDALARLGAERFDLILLDNNLPGMTGLKALAGIRRATAAPVLIVSGHCDDELARDAKLLGARGIVPKPVDMRQLAALLAELLEAEP